MIAIYCHRQHVTAGDTLCPECQELLDYALQRLSHCPKGNLKTSCRKCTIHCYSPLYRHKIQTVMRYVGPRMIFYHPISAIRHLITELK